MGDSALERGMGRIGTLITERPGTVVLAFLLVTAVFATGLGAIESEEGTDEFAEGVPAQDAQDEVDERFSPAFADDTSSVQLIQRSQGALTPTGLERNLAVQAELESDPQLDIEGTSSIAGAVAQTIEPSATTPSAQRAVIESTPDHEVRTTTRQLLAEEDGLAELASEDYSESSGEASATLTVVEFDGSVDESNAQDRAERAASAVDGEFTVFSGGLIEEEFETVISDSLAIVVPAVVLLILLFLAVAYRDPIDLLLGLAALGITVIWTFGFTGLVGIPFSEMMIAVPPLLLAIGVDFGIHSVNRYREERVAGSGVSEGMSAATDQLLIAFFIVAGTTVIGFGANVVSDLGPIRDFGIVASIGVVFTFLVFGLFMPAAKVLLDRARDGTRIPEFGTAPLGSDGSLLGRVLPIGATVGRRAPIAVLIGALLVTAGAGALATGVDTTFDDEDFLPPEELPGYVTNAPGPLAPSEYTFTETINFLADNFESGEDDEVTVYVEGPMETDYALESINRAGGDPPGTVISDGGQADSESIITVIESQAEEDEEFAALVDRKDVTGNGIPDRNLGEVYDALEQSEAGDRTDDFLTDDRRYTKVVYSVESGADDADIRSDMEAMSDDYRFQATPTGEIIIFQGVADVIFESAITSLVLALTLTAVFLMVIYRVLEGYATLGLANMVPIAVTVAMLVGTMPLLGIPFNAMTATVLSITIGVGVAYSVHVTHRFIDEFNAGKDGFDSLVTTLQGTGGALAGSMLTTLGGALSLMLAIIPILGQFGILMSISVVYSFLLSVTVLPPTLLLWERFVVERGLLP
ncbi:efflux RND transporter permease subunit [Natranaeroarchaeum sulfidigenes]|uniref:Putative exporter of the RND superfamily n=1 Tax=Natranaeroarchaeum sulfidigenes TaxID=2784880 RepID=A0A897MSS5_9EURY|nr:MMPL family transporter [Natranaeroarchaeum sulfidigenes]QSG01275.1 putative exporter of the RND superfamily [Natranaeroarchaeum sulfidigenes]